VGDNVAIAGKNLAPGTQFQLQGETHTIRSTLLEGQRFAIEQISQGDALLSWGLPFGHALRDIEPGEYLCNAGILEALSLRRLEFDLPGEPNFQDHIEEFQLSAENFKPASQVELYPESGEFEGYLRDGKRGVGTRNYIVILATSSLTAGFARALEARLKSVSSASIAPEQIVAVTHTEGGTSKPNNLELVMRTLAGFMVHPNVGAVLAVDFGTESVNNLGLEQFMKSQDYPLEHVLHRFHSLSEGFDAELDTCESMLREWFEPVGAMQRTKQPLSTLRIALQCGGSDAFSGVSGNPLAAWVAKEVLRHGGAAALAETDELIGAEPYILAKIRDLETGQKFLKKISDFKQRVGWHGHSAEGNPSGGNKFRGLYNIALKSIGAARKKDPEVRLDYVIDYGQPMTEPGFYFMDSPGNDLESIAGQVASGCNMIFFITGNGSITNFPFVPTIKFVTTTGRWNLLQNDMDINAGRYQDGTPMEDLGSESFAYTVDVASGTLSVGERAGHSQVSIWRDWQQSDGSQLEVLKTRRKPGGKPIVLSGDAENVKPPGATFRALPSGSAALADQLGLILPTSLCAGQIAKQIAARLNTGPLRSGHGVSHFVALPHTEGCGVSSGENEEHFTRTMIGHLVHPLVRKALLLEHGCERTHNDLMRHELEQRGISVERFGFASIQLDGGIDSVAARVEQWFEEALGDATDQERREAPLEKLPLGLLTTGSIPPATARAMANLACSIAANGGTVVVPANASLLRPGPFLDRFAWSTAPQASLEYGQIAVQPGLHIMNTPTEHLVESLTGLGGTGVQLMLAHVADRPLQAHPMISLLQISSRGCVAERFAQDLDAVLSPEKDSVRQIQDELVRLLARTASGDYQPRCLGTGNLDFQLTRGLLGVSL